MIGAIVSVFLLVLMLVPGKDVLYKTNQTVGTWWWHQNVDEDKYLDFAKKNSVTEIYYYNTAFNEKTANFVQKANKKGIKVYVLWGDKDWVVDSTPLKNHIQNYKEYQINNPDYKFEGIHLDIEPHQFEDFDETPQKRKEYLTAFANLVYEIVDENPDIKFDFDIPAWFNDDILLNGETKPLYQHITNIANRVFVMSYRDTAKSIINFAKDELNYAKTINKKIFLCVEMNSSEGDKVSFKEESKKYMYRELKKLEQELDQDFGVSIHHIETWYKLKKR